MVSETVAYRRAYCLLRVVEDTREAIRNIFRGIWQAKVAGKYFVIH